MNVEVNLQAIPDELKQLDQWVLWREEANDKGRTTKLPKTIAGYNASSTDPQTWNAFENVAERFSISDTFSGVGFVFSAEDPYCGIDLDGCRNPVTGEMADWALGWVDQLNSYTEVSPSGTGVKIFCRGKFPREKGAKKDLDVAKVSDKNPAIEVYDHGRYFTVTGQHVAGTPLTITTPNEIAFNQLVETVSPAIAVKTSAAPSGPTRQDLLETTWKYVSKCEDAISGSDGHGKTYHAACECFRFGLTDSEAAEVMRRFNATKTGDEPWNERELQHKLTSARNEVTSKGEFGVRLRNDWKPQSSNSTLAAETKPAPEFPRPMTMRELCNQFSELRRPVIHGLTREGETMNIIAATKTGKSWMMGDLALSIVTGRPWLEQYKVEPGEFLLIDNELHRETSAHRIPKIADARGIAFDEYNDRLHVANVRGYGLDIVGLGTYLEQFKPGQLKGVGIDAFYRLLPSDVSENDNAQMTNIYNAIDRYAMRLGCCFFVVHHSSKGNQSGKAVVDVGAGAGSQARATDTHLVLRAHQQDGAFVCDAAVRSWKPIEPFVMRWDFPVWQLAPDLDPTELKPDRPSRRKRVDTSAITGESVKPPKPEPWTAQKFVDECVESNPRTKGKIYANAQKAGLSEYKAEQLLKQAEGLELVHRWTFGGTSPHQYATTKQQTLQVP